MEQVVEEKEEVEDEVNSVAPRSDVVLQNEHEDNHLPSSSFSPAAVGTMPPRQSSDDGLPTSSGGGSGIRVPRTVTRQQRHRTQAHQQQQRQQSREEKRREIEAALSPSKRVANESTQQQQQQRDSVDSPNNNSNNDDNAIANLDLVRQETLDSQLQSQADDFAANLLAEQKKQQRNVPTDQGGDKCCLFEIDVLANESYPNQYADIVIREQSRRPGESNESYHKHNLEGLLPILLMALHVEHWHVVQIVLPTSINLQTKQEDEKEEEKLEDRDSTPSTTTCHRIIVQIPQTTNDSNNKLLNELRILLLSACDDYMSPSREALQPLVEAFEDCIFEKPKRPARGANGHVPKDRENSAPASSDNVSSQQPAQLPSTDQDEKQDDDEDDDERLQANQTSSLHPAAPAATTTMPNSPLSTQKQRPPVSGGIRPGAVPTMGRAFGAPVRPPTIPQQGRALGDQPSTRRTASSRWQSTRLWLSSRRTVSSRGTSASGSSNVPIIAAHIVEETDEEDLEADIRKRLMAEAAAASIVMTGDPSVILEESKKQRKYLILVTVLAVLLIGTVVGLAVGLSKANDEDDTSMPSLMPSFSPTAAPIPTLTTVRDRGSIHCSVTPPNFAISKLETELCRGLAAAVLNNSSKVELYHHPFQDIFQILDNRTVDVVIRGVTHAQSRTLREPTTGKAFAFSSPYFYGGLVFGGHADFVDCANRLDSYFGRCRQLIICAINTTTHTLFLSSRIPQHNIKLVPTFTGVLQEGDCNVIADESNVMLESLELATGFSVAGDSSFSIGTNMFTIEPLSIVTRSNDHEWTTIVDTVVQGLLEAEIRNITQGTALEFPLVPYGGPQYESSVIHAIQSIGNFGQVYNRTIAQEIPRAGLNHIRRLDDLSSSCEELGGLIVTFPFRASDNFEYDPVRGDTGRIAELFRQGNFRCGVPTVSREFQDFNVELCKAFSVALFGSVDHVKIVVYDASSMGAFQDLLVDDVDILMGVGSAAIPMLGADLNKYFLSIPYFFQPSRDGTTQESFVFVTKSSYYSWGALAEGIIMAIILADDRFISTNQNIQARLDDVADLLLQRIVMAVGNYGEIYERTMEASLPRSKSCNQLNIAPHGPQLFSFLFEGL